MRFFQTVFVGLCLLATAGASTEAKAEVLGGSFNNAPMKTKGMWYLDARKGGVFAMLSAGFATLKGPNLHIYLSKQDASEASGKQAEGDLHIAALKNYKGGQLYELPEGTDLSQYKSLVIVCDKFHQLWAAGDLRPE